MSKYSYRVLYEASLCNVQGILRNFEKLSYNFQGQQVNDLHYEKRGQMQCFSQKFLQQT